jgi:hypothetical protein
VRHLYHNLVTIYMVRYYHYLDRLIELSPTITTHTNEIHAYEMHAHEMYAYEVHAYIEWMEATVLLSTY